MSRLDRIADAWINAQEKFDEATNDKNDWSIELVHRWHHKRDYEILWRFILIVHNRSVSDNVAGMLAAGPLEDLLCDCGPEFIDRIEALARTDKRFRYLLKGIWGWTRMPEDVLKRLEKIRDSG